MKKLGFIMFIKIYQTDSTVLLPNQESTARLIKPPDRAVQENQSGGFCLIERLYFAFWQVYKLRTLLHIGKLIYLFYRMGTTI